jgi:hypothetical protein
MPGPFPGMDPYLEHPMRWRGVHGLLCAMLVQELNTLLPDAFAARMDERLYVLPSGQAIYPDTVLVDSPPRALAAAGRSPDRASSDTVLVTPPYVFFAEPEEVHEPFVEIVTADGREQVVTLIELLSPSNKAAGSVGQSEYRRKQQQALAAPLHLLEIDLLRGGAHTVAMPRASLLARKTFDYVVCLHRAGDGPRYECWLFTLRERAPQILIPLSDGFADVILDLQTCIDRVYDAGRYARTIDYQVEPEPPLSRGPSEWIDARLRERGFRS